MKLTLLTAALATAGLLAGCGGGGGSSDTGTSGGGSSNGGGTTSAAKVSLTGVAAKGLMANADVAVYAVNSDGTLASTALASTTTDAKGAYTLSFSGTKDQPVVVKVSAKADGSTTHLDEVSASAQALPSGFAMRALLVPTATGDITTSNSVTPFSELAVAAAAKAGGGITAANAAQATSTISQLLGFDPSTVAATTVAAASTANQQKLAVLLTAVSQLAHSGALGCSSGSAGDKTKCVVDTLASAASTTTLKLSTSSGTDVSAALGSALTTVLADSSLTGTVSAATLAVAAANLACTTSCTAASAGSSTGTDATATAIAAAKLLIAEIKTDWGAMFSSGGASSTASGAANQQAFKFQTAMTDVNVPVQLLAKDLGALLLGIDYYNDIMAGRDTDFGGRSRGDASLVANDGSVSGSSAFPAGCSVYQDSGTTVLATAKSNANYIGCGARFYVTVSSSGSTTVRTEWRHGFTITPNADGSFGYSTRARRRVTTCVSGSCTVTTNEALQTDASGAAIAAFTGTVTPTLSGSYGDITTFNVSGELPAAFKDGGNTLVSGSYKHVIAMSGTQTVNSDSTVVSTLAGTLKAVDSSSATTGTLTLKPGSSLSQVPVSFDASGNMVSPSSPAAVGTSGAHTLSGLSLGLVFSTSSAEFEGSLTASGATWDASGTELEPTSASLSGALRNLDSSGSSTEFINGTLSATSTGWSSFNAKAVQSSGNRYTLNFVFTGTITAPSRPTLALTWSSGWINDGGGSGGGTPIDHTVQYRTLVAGTPKLVVNLVGTRDHSDGGVSHIALSEDTAKLAIGWDYGASTADLYYNTSTKIGTVTRSTGLLTFTDGSFVSVDLDL